MLNCERKILLISGNIYPGVGSLSSEVALVSIDSCNKPAKQKCHNNFNMTTTISPNTEYYHIQGPPWHGSELSE